MVAMRQNKKVTASTVASGRNLTTKEKFIEPSNRASEWSRRSLHQTLTNKPDQAAADGEQQTFAEQLAHDSPTRRANRQTQRDLFRARSAAGQQHVREIQAGDEQHRAGHSHQQRADERYRAVVIW